jgi:phospholipid/cholesterol/gamma-HCH transport system substrate-binding protein
VAIKDTLLNFETFTASLSSDGEKISSVISTAESGINAVDDALTKTKTSSAASPATNMAANCCRP